jgi:hypothetical protein
MPGIAPAYSETMAISVIAPALSRRVLGSSLDSAGCLALALCFFASGCGGGGSNNTGAGASGAGASGGNSGSVGGSAGSGASGGSSGGSGASTAGGSGNAGGSGGSAQAGTTSTSDQQDDACTGGPNHWEDNTEPSADDFEDPCITNATCEEGVWFKLDLPGLAGNIQTVVADPVRPSDFYLWSGSNNGPTIQVFKSTDFGDTWTQINTTAEITGNPWGASIDPNPNRDPSTIPVMWSPSGYGANGAWKSTDGGVTWERSAGCDAAFANYNPFGTTLTDLYHVQILPDDPPNHVLATYHYYFKDEDEGGLGETTDGGDTWVVHLPPQGWGTSHYVMPISATTWAVIAQEDTAGIWRTTTAGRINGTVENGFRDGEISVDAWEKVDNLEHAHGSHQNLVLSDGKTVLASGNTNGARSTDCGETWEHFSETGSWAEPHQFEQSRITNLAITDTYIYTNSIGSPELARAPLDNPIGAANWDVEYCETPGSMTTGAAVFSMASSYDPKNQKWIVLSGVDNGGLYKYVEP